MLSDAHCHPHDLLALFPSAEEQRKTVKGFNGENGVRCAANALNKEQFEYNEKIFLAPRDSGLPDMVLCYAVHPQLPAYYAGENAEDGELKVREGLELLRTFAEEGRLGAVGETGFDFYDEKFRAAEKMQEELFAAHIETALEYELPVVLHVRKAMHKVFARVKELKKCRSVIFHSWPGTKGEGEALLRKGVNAYFSFGTAIRLNHKEAMRCCASFPAERILTETDAPYQGLRGKPFSSWDDIPGILETASELRGEKKEHLERVIEKNFLSAFHRA
jgi:TatD DNase family protein